MKRRDLRFLLLLPLICAGCDMVWGGSAATPSSDRAREALEKSLNTWKNGKPPGMVEGTSPPVQAVDSKWQSGSRLESFEILREDPAGVERRFIVNLHLAKPSMTAETSYLVVGSGPIWVYREEDYQRMLNMDNNPDPRRKARAGR
jgi:hypothetical protein